MKKICIACGELRQRHGKGMCKQCYSRCWYLENREARLAAGRLWKIKNPNYDKNYRKRNKERIAAQQRLYRQRNTERIKAYQRDYREKHRKELNAHNQRYYYEHHEQEKARRRQYHWEHREKDLAKNRRWMQEHPNAYIEWYQANREKKLAYNRDWEKRNPESGIARKARRAARKRALPDTLTGFEVEQIFKMGRCFYCGAETTLALDHFVPLGADSNVACGTTRANSTVACKSCNSWKGIKMPEQILGQLSLV